MALYDLTLPLEIAEGEEIAVLHLSLAATELMAEYGIARSAGPMVLQGVLEAPACPRRTAAED